MGLLQCLSGRLHALSLDSLGGLGRSVDGLEFVLHAVHGAVELSLDQRASDSPPDGDDDGERHIPVGLEPLPSAGHATLLLLRGDKGSRVEVGHVRYQYPDAADPEDVVVEDVVVEDDHPP